MKKLIIILMALIAYSTQMLADKFLIMLSQWH